MLTSVNMLHFIDHGLNSEQPFAQYSPPSPISFNRVRAGVRFVFQIII